MKTSNANVIFIVKSAIFIVFFAFLLYSQASRSWINNDLLIISSYYLLMALSLICLLSSRKLSLFGVFYLFAFIFYSYVPYYEYINGVVYWSDIPFRDSDYLLANIVIFIIVFLIRVSELVFSRRLGDGGVEYVCHTRINLYLMVLLALACVLLALFANDYNVSSLLFRGGAQESKYTPINQILTNISRFLSLLLFLSIYYSRSNVIVKFFFLIVVVFCSFPMSMPRYFVAAIYIPVLWSVVPFFRLGQRLVYFILLSFFTLFPLLDNVRRINSFGEYSFTYSMDFVLAGHFDSYQSFVRVIQQDIIVGWGQLLGNMLFFVPRNLWEDKPYGSGYFMADFLGYSFKNISMNYFSEGYINSGFYGVFLFLCFLIYFMVKGDQLLYMSNGRVSKFVFIFLFSVFIILMRGDLVTGMSVLFSFFVSVALCVVLLKKI